jgi:hypothetical protein
VTAVPLLYVVLVVQVGQLALTVWVLVHARLGSQDKPINGRVK